MTRAVDYKKAIEPGITLMNIALQMIEQLKAMETRAKKTTRMKKTVASPIASRTQSEPTTATRRGKRLKQEQGQTSSLMRFMVPLY